MPLHPATHPRISTPFLLFSLLAGLLLFGGTVAHGQTATPPSWQMQIFEQVTPAEARAWRLAISKQTSAASSLSGAVQQMVLPENIPEIQAQARALRNDVDLIYQFVHDNIRFSPGYGLQKGALGTLLDEEGNAYDQAALMIALLRAAGYASANFVLGEIEVPLTPEGADLLVDWLAYPASPDAQTTFNRGLGLLFNSKVPYVCVATCAFEHAWVQVDIGATTYAFDPSLKGYLDTSTGTRTQSHVLHTPYFETLPAPTDLQTILSYNQTNFLGNALTGAGHTPGLSLSNINRSGIRADLGTMANSLVAHIKANKPDARLEDLIGGADIVPLGGVQLRQTAHPYQTGTPEIFASVPNDRRTRMDISFDTVDQTFYSDDIYGRRLTVTFTGALSNEPTLMLDGVTVATGSAVAAPNMQIGFCIDHPYVKADETPPLIPFCDPGSSGVPLSADQNGSTSVGVGGTYFIANGWGRVGRKIVERHRRILAENRAAGAADTSEEVLGQTVAIIGVAWMAEGSAASQITDGLSGDAILVHPASIR